MRIDRLIEEYVEQIRALTGEGKEARQERGRLYGVREGEIGRREGGVGNKEEAVEEDVEDKAEEEGSGEEYIEIIEE